MMMSVTAQSIDYGAFMRNSMSATADLLQSIERDIQESRQLIQSKNTDERALTQLVFSLEEDNHILLGKVHSLEQELSNLQMHFAQSNDELYKEFEGKILACNGEIERVVAQCNDINNERATLEEQLRQAESECANATSELQYAKQTIHGLTTQVDEVSAENAHLSSELHRTTAEVQVLQQQQRLTALQLQQAQLLQNTAQGLTQGGGTANLYSDDDIAGLLQRIKHLEEGRTLLAQQHRRHGQPRVGVNTPYSPPSSAMSASPTQSFQQHQNHSSPGRLTYVVVQAPRRDLSPPVPSGAAMYYPVTTTGTESSSVVHTSEQPSRQLIGAGAYNSNGAVSPASSRAPNAFCYSVAASSPSTIYTNTISSGGGRRLESPESDEGQPYELEDTYTGNNGSGGNSGSSHMGSHMNSHVVGSQHYQHDVPDQQSDALRAVQTKSSPIANTGLYTTDYSCADTTDVSDLRDYTSTAAVPAYGTNSPSSSASDNHTWNSRLASYGQTREPRKITEVSAATWSAPVSAPAPGTVYHDVLRSSSEVMAEARRTLHNSRSRDPKNAPVAATAATGTATSKSGTVAGNSQMRSQQPQQQVPAQGQALTATNRVRFSSPQQASYVADRQTDTAALSDTGDSYHTPYAKVLTASHSHSYDQYDQYDSHLLPPQQQLDPQQDTADGSPDDVPEYIAPFSTQGGEYDAYSSATEYNPMEHSLLQHQPAAASPVMIRHSYGQTSTTAGTHSQGGEMAHFSPTISPVQSPRSPYSTRADDSHYSVSGDHTERASFVPRGSQYRAEREEFRAQVDAKAVGNDAVYARDGEEDQYPDDFESYDDNVGGYLDDEGSLAHDHRNAHYDSSYHEYGGDGDNVDEIGAIEDLEGSMSDNEMNNVFMYDGSSAVDMLAMQEHPYESYDLDELSRLDM